MSRVKRRYSTLNNGVHFLLTILTGGLWLLWLGLQSRRAAL